MMMYGTKRCKEEGRPIGCISMVCRPVMPAPGTKPGYARIPLDVVSAGHRGAVGWINFLGNLALVQNPAS